MLHHMVLVPHGIRKYAEKHKLSLMDAYDFSSGKFLDLITWVFQDHEIENFTFYGLSYEAITTREEEELIPIFEVESTTYKNLLSDDTIMKGEIGVHFVGNFSKLPKYYIRAMNELQEATKDFNKKILYIFIGYNSQKRKMENFEKWKSKKVDLLIEIGKKSSSTTDEFTEEYFIDKYFPEINREDINEAINYYYSSL